MVNKFISYIITRTTVPSLTEYVTMRFYRIVLKLRFKIPSKEVRTPPSPTQLCVGKIVRQLLAPQI